MNNTPRYIWESKSLNLVCKRWGLATFECQIKLFLKRKVPISWLSRYIFDEISSDHKLHKYTRAGWQKYPNKTENGMIASFPHPDINVHHKHNLHFPCKSSNQHSPVFLHPKPEQLFSHRWPPFSTSSSCSLSLRIITTCGGHFYVTLSVTNHCLDCLGSKPKSKDLH